VENSIISRNRQGVVIFETSRPDLGQLVEEAGRSIGENRIFGNDEHDIYSRSSERIFAQNNYWNSNDLKQIRSLIETVPGEDSKAGEILIEPFLEHSPLLAANLSTPPPASRSSRTISPKKSVKKPEAKQPPPKKRTASKPPVIKPKPAVAESKAPEKKIIPSKAASKSAVEDRKNATIVDEKPKIVLLEPEETATNSRALNPTRLQRPGEPIIEMMLDNNEREYIERKRPSYPSVYLASGVEGIVLVEVFVGKDGRIDSKRVLRSDGDAFTEAAEEALKSYRYKPGTINGVPVPYRLVERFTFEIK
ncbi:MAG: TonB family protein, partial [Calditrichota bacterium]